VAGSPLMYSSRCSVLSPLGADSPNSNFEFDSLANIIAHEIAETVTDPQGNAWYFDASGGENGDQCQWIFGSIKTVNGRYYNEVMGTNKYLIQEMWNKNTRSCNQ